MSVSSVATTQQIQAQQAYRPPPRPDNDQDAGTTASSGMGAAQGSGGTNPFARLVTDLQSALVSMQGTSGNAASVSTGAAATATSDPMATLKSDLQSIVTQFQSGGSQAAAGGPQGAGCAHPHHHHHKDSDTEPAGAIASTSAAATPATSGATPPSRIVDSILQSFQSAMQGGSAKSSSGTTASLSLSA
jgi:hypothetical protein